MAWTILRLLDAKTFMNANDEIMFLRVYYIFLMHTYIYTPSFSHTHTHTYTPSYFVHAPYIPTCTSSRVPLTRYGLSWSARRFVHIGSQTGFVVYHIIALIQNHDMVKIRKKWKQNLLK